MNTDSQVENNFQEMKNDCKESRRNSQEENNGIASIKIKENKEKSVKLYDDEKTHAVLSGIENLGSNEWKNCCLHSKLKSCR